MGANVLKLRFNYNDDDDRYIDADDSKLWFVMISYLHNDQTMPYIF